jgi:hypothetical protein
MRKRDNAAMKDYIRCGMESGIWVVEKALRRRGDVSEYPEEPPEIAEP